MKWFCRHKDSKEIARYYKTYYSTNWYITYYLDACKVFKCNKCEKEFAKKLFAQNYLWEADRIDDICELKEMGYISYERYILK